MTTYYENINELSKENIVLKKNGEIWLRLEGYKFQKIGTWSLSHPRRDQGKHHYRRNELVERIYEGGIPYKGTATGYSRNDFIDVLIAIVKREGLSIVSSITNE